jgi:diguanylate cyclase (GGDEF)-like protein
VTESNHASGDDAQRGEFLYWQGRYRIGLAALVAGTALLLRALGLISGQSIAVSWLGEDGTTQAFGASAVAYILLIVALRWRLGMRRQASLRLVGAVLVADVAVVYVCALLLTPPAEFDRTLIISVFLVQFTQLYFGWRTTLFQLATVAVCYSTLIALARKGGALPAPGEALWTFALFCVGSLTYAWVLGHRGTRMRRLTKLFDRAREGDFDQSYDDQHDEFPDHITEIGRAYNQLRGHLETIILTDPLSGCFNRRGFEQFSAREVARGVRAKWRLAVLALDVDHFKQINDEFGHLTGDEAIKEIGALLRDIARAGDVLARSGGEEFSILAPDTDEVGAMHLADRILQAFRTRAFISVRGQMPITISIGVASDEAGGTEEIVRTLTARADEALYVAKRNGRDQAVLWQTGMRAFELSGARLSREMERLR